MDKQPSHASSIHYVFEQLSTQFVQSTEMILTSRQDYENQRGHISQDDPSWEAWSQCFFEWFLFQWTMADSQKHPIDIAIEKSSDSTILEALRNSHHSLFFVEKMTNNGLEIEDLLTNVSYKVSEERTLYGIGKNDVLEARIVSVDGNKYFTKAFWTHPSGTKGIIKKYIQWLRTQNITETTEIIDRIAQIRVLAERYRDVPAIKTYKKAVAFKNPMDLMK